MRSLTWWQVAVFFLALWTVSSTIHWLVGNDQAARVISAIFWPATLLALIAALIEYATRKPERKVEGPDLPERPTLAHEEIHHDTPSYPCSSLDAGDRVRVVDSTPFAPPVPKGAEGEVVAINLETGRIGVRIEKRTYNLPLDSAPDYLQFVNALVVPPIAIDLPNGEQWLIRKDGLRQFVLAYTIAVANGRYPSDAPHSIPPRDVLVDVQKAVINNHPEPLSWLASQPWETVESAWAHRIMDPSRTTELWKKAALSVVQAPENTTTTVTEA